MKLTAKTLSLLQNFGAINQGIIIKEGKRLRTLSVLENIYAESDIDVEFPREFGIYDLNELLATISLLDSPELEFKSDHVLITSGSTKIKYYYSSPSLIVSPPDKDLTLQDKVATLTLSKQNLSRILKAGAALKLKELKFTNSGVVVFVTKGGDNQVAIGIDVDGDIQGTPTIKIDNMRMLEDDYTVNVYERAVEFISQHDSSLRYVVTVEAGK